MSNALNKEGHKFHNFYYIISTWDRRYTLENWIIPRAASKF